MVQSIGQSEFNVLKSTEIVYEKLFKSFVKIFRNELFYNANVFIFEIFKYIFMYKCYPCFSNFNHCNVQSRTRTFANLMLILLTKILLFMFYYLKF